MRVIAGADEAGKGPVLGPLVVAAVALPEDSLHDGYRDSKELPEKRREWLAEEVREEGEVSVVPKPPEEIDERGIDTALRDAYVEALSDLDSRVEIDRCLADAADVDADRFADLLTRRVGREVRAEHRADENHRIVAAASIVAKVERDRRMEEVGERLDAEVGSGYPSDPVTREFLESHVEDNGKLPGCARRSWKTSERVMAERTQSGLGDF